MKAFTTLSRSPSTEKYLDNNGTYFNVSRLYLTDNSGAIINGAVNLIGSTTETARILEICANNQLIVDSLAGSFVNGDTCQLLSYDPSVVGVNEVVAGAAQVTIFPPLVMANDIYNDRLDLKQTNVNIRPLLAQNEYYSSGLIIGHHTSGRVKIDGSATNPIVFCRPFYIFYEVADVTLDITAVGNNQFVDIYIEDKGTTPHIVGTKIPQLVGKAAGTTPYSTSPSAGQFLIGSCYIKNNLIVGIQSKDQKKCYHKSYINETSFGLSITSVSAYDYGVQEFYVPVFDRGVFHFDLNIQTDTGVNAATDWSYDIGIDINNVVQDCRTIRLSPMPTNTKEGRIPVKLEGSIPVNTPQLLTIKIGGKINDLYTYSNAIGVTKVVGDCKVTYDQHYQQIASVNPVISPSFSAIKTDFASGAIYSILEYLGNIYTSEYETSGGNHHPRIWKYDTVATTWAASSPYITVGWTSYYTRACVYNNKMYWGGYSSYASAVKTRFDGSTWDEGVTLSNSVKRDMVGYNNNVYTGYDAATARIYRSGDGTGDTGTFTVYAQLPAGNGGVYTFKEWNNLLYVGTDIGKIYTYDGGVDHTGLSFTERADFATATYIRGMTILDEFLVASSANVVKITTDGITWQTIASPAGITAIHCMITVGPYVLACGGGPDPQRAKLFYTDRNFTKWTEIVVDGAMAHEYFSSMCYFNGYLYLVTRNSSLSLKNKVYKGTLS